MSSLKNVSAREGGKLKKCFGNGFKLKTKDKKGIVSTIMQILDDFEVRVEDVKISTQKNIARDLFIISKENGFCAKLTEILKRLCK